MMRRLRGFVRHSRPTTREFWTAFFMLKESGRPVELSGESR
ncbi:MAG: hypothetical protein H7318_14220 [Oligoflexus sp.]|nr:hypothetical protein [Oligoflexus sp.]